MAQPKAAIAALKAKLVKARQVKQVAHKPVQARGGLIEFAGKSDNLVKGSQQTLDVVAGFIEGTRWAVAPANKDAAVRILAERLKVTPEVAARTSAWR